MKGLTLSLLHLHLHFAFCISNLNCQNLDGIGVVVGGVHSDKRGTYSFGHSALLGSHENFRYEQKIWVWAKILGSGENFRFG